NDGDHRNQGRRHGGGHRRQHAPDRALGQVQLMAEPLDPVGEQLGAQQDEREGSDQQDNVHWILLSTERRRPRAGTWSSVWLGPEVLRRVRKERDVPGPLQRRGQHALMSRARTGLPAWLDLRPLGEITAEAVDLLVVDALRLVDAEVADLATTPIAVVVGRLAT